MNAAMEGRTMLRRGTTGWLGGFVTALFIGALTFFFAVFGMALVFAGKWVIALILLTLSFWMFVLTRYVWRDSQAKRHWTIGIEPGEILLDLPAGRSLMAPGPRVRRVIELSDVACIETRLEAYRSFGLANMQRSYGLRLTSGELIVLGEDRALATSMADEAMGRMVDTIIAKTGLALRDLGMIEGKGGFLGVLFTSVPRWDTPGASAAHQAMLWRRASLTGGMIGIIILSGLMLSVLI